MNGQEVAALRVADALIQWADGYRALGGEFTEAATATARDAAMTAFRSGHGADMAFELGRATYFRSLQHGE